MSRTMPFSPITQSTGSSLFCAEHADDVASWGVDVIHEEPADYWEAPSFFPIPGERPFSVLLAAEEYHMPRPGYLSRIISGSIDATARLDAINWISKVSEFYRFSPVTAYLAVNYLDRFLSGNSLPAAQGLTGRIQSAGGWPMQLLSVACVSVAAKIEETHVPLLLDLQILDPKFVFEPRTICRMELLLMASLRWRMRAVTPFDFLPHFSAAALSGNGVGAPVGSTLFFRAADLILRTHGVIGFLGFRPSTIAAAVVLCAAGEIVDSLVVYDANYLGCLGEWAGKEMVRDCWQLMEERLMVTFPSARRSKALTPAVEPPAPLSPAGVLDAAAYGSCDSQKSSADEMAGPDSAGGFSPAFKRRRIFGNLCIKNIEKERG